MKSLLVAATTSGGTAGSMMVALRGLTVVQIDD